MDKHTTSEISLNKQDKDNKYIAQLKVVFEYLQQNTASRFMVAVATGIPLQNVCRHVDKLFKSNLIAVIRKDQCKISGRFVGFLTTDKTKFPVSRQLNMF
jgi:hypothetical protein